MTARQLTNRQSYWLDHYNQCKEQGLSFEEYGRRHSLSSGAFGHARKTLIDLGAIAPKKTSQSTKSAGFVCAKPTQASPQMQMAQIILPGQINIELPLAAINTILPNLLLGVCHDSSR